MSNDAYHEFPGSLHSGTIYSRPLAVATDTDTDTANDTDTDTDENVNIGDDYSLLNYTNCSSRERATQSDT